MRDIIVHASGVEKGWLDSERMQTYIHTHTRTDPHNGEYKSSGEKMKGNYTSM